jgi:hypothetical protein
MIFSYNMRARPPMIWWLDWVNNQGVELRWRLLELFVRVGTTL